MNFLTRLGSRAYIVGEIASAVLLAKSCDTVETSTGSGGSGGETTTETTASGGTGGDAGSGGEGATGGTGGTATTGGSGGVGGTGGVGGSGGETTTTGSGGTGGCAAEPHACAPNECGAIANECGVLTNCGGCNDPMECGVETHVCECKTAGVPQGSCSAMYPLQCAAVGGCVDAICPLPSDPKFPEQCQVFAPDGTSCCGITCSTDAECDDGNECTTNGCGGNHLCEFLPDMAQPPCADGSGVCISGECVPL